MRKYFLVGLMLLYAMSSQAQMKSARFRGIQKAPDLNEVGIAGTGAIGIRYSYLYFYTASGYVNFTSTTGSGGYGFRDNSGTMQVKNSGGSWANIAGASGSAGGWTDDGTIVRLTTATDKVGINKATPAVTLDVGGSTGEVARFASDTGINDSSYVSFGGTRSMIGYYGTELSLALQAGLGKGIHFNVNNATFGSGTVMVIRSTGNIGIGTLAPAHLLHLNGGNIAFGDTTTGDVDAWIYYADDGDVTSSKSGFDDGNSQFEWWINGNQAMKLGAGGILYVDDTGSGAAAQVDVFDKYDDIELIRAYVIGEWEKLPKELFVGEKKETIRHNQLRQLIGGALLQLDARLSQLEEKTNK